MEGIDSDSSTKEMMQALEGGFWDSFAEGIDAGDEDDEEE